MAITKATQYLFFFSEKKCIKILNFSAGKRNLNDAYFSWHNVYVKEVHVVQCDKDLFLLSKPRAKYSTPYLMYYCEQANLQIGKFQP